MRITLKGSDRSMDIITKAFVVLQKLGMRYDVLRRKEKRLDDPTEVEDKIRMECSKSVASSEISREFEFG